MRDFSCISELYVYYNETEDLLKFCHCPCTRQKIVLGTLKTEDFYNMSSTQLNNYMYSILKTQDCKCPINENYKCSDFWYKGIDKLFVSISRECNLNCPMCYVKGGGHKDSEKRKQLYLDFIRKLKDVKFKNICLTDWGEPLIYIEEVLDILKSFNRNDLGLILTTNLTLLDSKILNKMYEISSFLFFEIDCDSLNKETYEKIRVGAKFEDYYEKLFYFIDFYKSHRDKVSCKLHTVELPINKDEIEEIKEFAYEYDMGYISAGVEFFDSDIYKY